MSPLELSLGGAALVIGMTGTWSPCGFSMVETLGLAGDGGRRFTAAAACAAFVPGAVVGGVVTFVLLSGFGELIHGAGRAAYLVAAGIAVVAAAAEARGLRIVPQIRRQLPESWRWTMPLPAAALLYGVLLGLGFTTFVLSFGVWALAGISLALGNVEAGLVIGAAFGVGRAMPIVVVALQVDGPLGQACLRGMAERPAIYRLFRLGDAATLGLVAAVLVTTTATAQRIEVMNGADPSVAGKAIAFQKGNGAGVVRVGGETHRLPGHDPALGGPLAAVISGGQIKILNRFKRNVLTSLSAPHAEALAISRAARLPEPQPRPHRADGEADHGHAAPGPGEADRDGRPAGRNRPSKPHRGAGGLHGLWPPGQLDQAGPPELGTGAHATDVAERAVAQPGHPRQAARLRPGFARLAGAACDHAQAAPPVRDVAARRGPREGAPDLPAEPPPQALDHLAGRQARLRHPAGRPRPAGGLGPAVTLVCSYPTAEVLISARTGQIESS